MSDQPTWKRIRERLELKLPVRVLCKETPDFEWTEVTRLNNVTPFGCSFTLKRPTEKGRLVYMTIPMPRQLRVFDHAEDQYRIWALVRYAKPSIPPDEKTTIFEVGVAFIGKRAPASYLAEPWRRYEIATTSAQQMAKPDEIKPISTSDQRIYTRHNIPVDMQVEVMDENGNVRQTEQTVTENISRSGAILFTTLQIPIGRFIQLTSAQYGLTVFAVVRARSTGADGIPRIHVEFIDKEWPL
jgi:hypothetical protein